MTTESKITDRTLERLKLGELSDDEAADLMARLEDAGESHRLDAIIEADEEFLERYPAAVAASQIRERARRRRRANLGREDVRGTWRVLALPALAALTLGLVMLGLYVAGDSDEAPEPEVSDSIVREPIAENEVEPPDEQPSAPSMPVEPVEPVPEWKGLLNWVLENEWDGLIAIACTPGEEMSFDAKGIARVSIDQSKLVSVRPTEDKKNLIMTCNETGLANLNVIREDHSSTNLIARIAAPYEEPESSSPGFREQLNTGTEKCGELEEMELRVVLERSHFPSLVIVGGGTEQQRECVREVAKQLRGTTPPTEDSPAFTLFTREW